MKTIKRTKRVLKQKFKKVFGRKSKKEESQ